MLETQERDEGTYKVEISNSFGKATEEIEVELILQNG